VEGVSVYGDSNGFVWAFKDVVSCLELSFCPQFLDFFERWLLVICPAANGIPVNRMTTANHDRLIPALPIAMMEVSL